ncbi:hypothetical protein GCM10010341_58020 [Streptomyces noursei]|nr:hypothetical protein GCM10010341_58020 [Streptomyces noursei]
MSADQFVGEPCCCEQALASRAEVGLHGQSVHDGLDEPGQGRRVDPGGHLLVQVRLAVPDRPLDACEEVLLVPALQFGVVGAGVEGARTVGHRGAAEKAAWMYVTWPGELMDRVDHSSAGVMAA